MGMESYRRGLNASFQTLRFPFFFRDDANTATRRYPSRSFIRQILYQANKCDLDGKGESSWNMDIHARILAWLLEDDSNEGSRLGSEYCTSTGLLREYNPKDTPSKMIDFCLNIRPKPSEEQEIIDNIRSRRLGDSINHTDWGSLSKHPIAISIETKRYGEQYDAALLQIATWHSASGGVCVGGGQRGPNVSGFSTFQASLSRDTTGSLYHLYSVRMLFLRWSGLHCGLEIRVQKQGF